MKMLEKVAMMGIRVRMMEMALVMPVRMVLVKAVLARVDGEMMTMMETTLGRIGAGLAGLLESR